jgi:hypothetical protein
VLTEDFIERVFPRGGHAIVATKGAKGFEHFSGSFDGWVREVCTRIDGKELPVWIACASYKIANVRKGDNVHSVRSFWLDLDVGTDAHKYPSQAEAAKALRAFYVELDLGKPLVVDSGYGLHVWFPMDEDMSPDEWKAVAFMLKECAKLWGLKADPSRTADIASLLRLPGTFNRKNPDKPRQVRVMQEPDRFTLDVFRADLESYLGAQGVDLSGIQGGGLLLPRGGPPRGLDVAMNDDLSGGVERPPSSAHAIADRCPVIGHIRDTRGNVPQPLWYHGLGVLARTNEAPDICHAWSNGHPNYTRAETDAAIARVGQFGPTTCDKFSDLDPSACAACPLKGTVTSPITLGTMALRAVLVGPPPKLAKRLQQGAAIPELNEHCAYTPMWGQAPTFLMRTPDGGWNPCKRSDLIDRLGNVFVESRDEDGNVKRAPAANFWLTHPNRREFSQVVYQPEGPDDPEALNLWTGLGLQPLSGSWNLMGRHLLDVICRGDKALLRYLVNWMAHALQRPGTAPGTVVVLKSASEGTGKTTVCSWLAAMFGRHGAQFNTPDQLLGQFNAHLETLSFIAINEPSFAGDHSANRKFKSMISDTSWVIEAKYQPQRRVPNVAHIMLTTNEEWAVAAGQHARRFFVLDVDPARAGDAAYFKALHAEANSGGIEAMMHALLKHDISGFDPVAHLPFTAALADQQLLSASPHVRWALDLAEQGLNGQATVGQSEFARLEFGKRASTAALYTDYDAFARRETKHTLSRVHFGRWLGALGLQPLKSNGEAGWQLPDPGAFASAVRQSAGIR